MLFPFSKGKQNSQCVNVPFVYSEFFSHLFTLWYQQIIRNYQLVSMPGIKYYNNKGMGDKQDFGCIKDGQTCNLTGLFDSLLLAPPPLHP
jgi:hypothetical protein